MPSSSERKERVMRQGTARFVRLDEGQGHYPRWIFGLTTVTVVDGAKISEK